MDKFTVHSGVAAPLLRINIDTDAIIPGQFCHLTDFKELGDHCFEFVRRSESLDGRDLRQFRGRDVEALLHPLDGPRKAFLVDDQCSIYAERPLTCREHLALSPAARCSAVGDEGLVLLTLAAYASRASNAMEDGPSMEEGGWVALPLALAYAESHAEAPPVAPAPQLLQRFFDALTTQADDAEPAAAGG